MLGLVATMALLRSRAGRSLLRCLAVVGILIVYNYILFVKIIIAILVLSEIAAWIIPLDAAPQPERTPTVLPPDAGFSNDDEISTGPYRAPWRGQEGDEEEDMHPYLEDSAMHPKRAPTNFTAPAEPSNVTYASDRTGPSRPNRRQQEEIHRHLQRLAMAAAAADAATAPASVFTSHYYSTSVMGGYPERVGGTFGAATLSSSNPSAAQAENTDFWTRSQFPVNTAPPVATEATRHDRLRHGSRVLGHSKSLPDPPPTYNHEDVYSSWTG